MSRPSPEERAAAEKLAYARVQARIEKSVAEAPPLPDGHWQDLIRAAVARVHAKRARTDAGDHRPE